MNKSLFAFACLLAVVTAAVTPVPSEHPDFDSWTKIHGKEYKTTEELNYRRSVYAQNIEQVNFLNSLRTDETDAHYEINHFGDMTADEFETYYHGMNGSAQQEAHAALPEAALLDVEDAPASVDWRAKGAVTPVKNQGQCGSCWAFSTTGDVEGKWFLAGNKLTPLSESELVDCDHNGDQGCQGGLPTNAFAWIQQNGGLESEESYPYKPVNGKCAFDKSKVVAKISGFEKVSTDEKQIAAFTAANGPLSIGINAGPMQFYAGGVANPLFCSPKKIDHGVLIVGYGTDAGKDYWIIKNSWGAGWGEKGYYRIVRGKGKCGLNTMVSSSKV